MPEIDVTRAAALPIAHRSCTPKRKSGLTACPSPKTNVLGTHTLLECSKQYNIRRFIHVSTDEVPSRSRAGYSVRSAGFSASVPLSPQSAAAAAAPGMRRTGALLCAAATTTTTAASAAAAR